MDLQFRLKRIALRDSYTIGHLYVYENGDWRFLCDTLEDKVRDLNKNGRFDNGEYKVYGETAIPYGRYEIDMNTISPKFKTRAWGKKYNGIVPRFKNVDSFEGVLCHPLNKAADSLGCVGVGKNDKVGWISNSTNTYYMLMDKYLIPARNKGQKVFIDII
jgi:hypothetical protein